MYNAYSSLRRILINDYYVSTSVTADNIRVGFAREIDSYPCITMHRIGGGSYPRLGYQSSTGDSRDRMDTYLMQIDIFDLNSIENLELLDDKVIRAVHSGAQTGEGYRLTNNTSMYDDSYDAYRSIQTWSLSKMQQD